MSKEWFTVTLIAVLALFAYRAGYNRGRLRQLEADLEQFAEGFENSGFKVAVTHRPEDRP